MRRLPTETIRFLTLDEAARLFRAIGPHRRDLPGYLDVRLIGLDREATVLDRVEYPGVCVLAQCG